MNRRFPIRAKLLVLAGALLAFAAFQGVLSIRNLGAVNAKGGSMYRDRVVPVRDLGKARSLLGDIDSQILRTFGTTADAQPLVAAAHKDQQGVDALIDTYEATYLVDAEKRGLTGFHRTWSEYTKVYGQFAALGAAGRDAEA